MQKCFSRFGSTDKRMLDNTAGTLKEVWKAKQL